MYTYALCHGCFYKNSRNCRIANVSLTRMWEDPILSSASRESQAACIQNGADVYIARTFWRRRIKKMCNVGATVTVISGQLEFTDWHCHFFWRYEISFFFTLTSTLTSLRDLLHSLQQVEQIARLKVCSLINQYNRVINCECIVSLNDPWNFQ